MSYITENDRHYIENKYHREELFEQNRGTDHALAKARGFAFILDHARIDVSQNDWFFGLYNWARPLTKTFLSKWYTELFDTMPDVRELMHDYNASGTAELWLDTEHVVPYWVDILKLGFPGLLARVRNYHAQCTDLTPKKEAFYQAIETEYEAILQFLSRLAAYADAHPGTKSGRIAASLRTIRDGAPQSTFDALQTMYTYHALSEYVDCYQARSLGNGLDRSLYAFWKRDIESGTFTRDEIKGFLAYFLLQFSAVGNYWGQPFYLCGTDYDGKTDISEWTLDILEVYDSLDLYNPKIQVKINPDTNPKIIDKVLRMIRAGHTSFVFCCEPGIVKSLMSCYGVTEEEAKNVDISGCNEMHIRGKESCMISALPNAAKAIEYVFNDGIDGVTGKRLGLATGDVAKMESFEAFYAAFLKQFAHILDTVMDAARRYEKHVGETNPSVLLSAAVERAWMPMRSASNTRPLV